MNGVGDDDGMDDVGGFDAVEDSAQGGTGSSSGGGVGASVGEDIGLPNDSVDAMIARGIDPALETVTPTSFMGISITPNSAYEDELENTEIGNYTDASGMMHGISVTDSFGGDGSAAFPSMYDPAPPVVEPPVIQPPATQPGPTTSYEDSILFNFTPRERHSYLLNQINMGMEPTRGYTGPDGVYVDLTTVYPDIFNPDNVTFPDIGRPSIPAFETTQPMLPISGNEGFELPPGTRDPRTGRIYSRDTSWLIPPPAGSINTMAIEPHIHPITGEIAYVTSGGWTIDPEIYNQLKTEGDGVMPRMTLGDPGGYDLNPVTGDYIDGGFKYGGYVDDYRMNRGGIMDLREPHRYNRGGNVMRNIRDEQARVIGVQDDAADEMNRIRYHSGRDARDERFRVAARERDARAEMGRLRGEARYEDMHGRGPRLFGHGGGVASLAPVARNMFRKRRLPRAGMVV